jgi:hypothetical protein
MELVRDQCAGQQFGSKRLTASGQLIDDAQQELPYAAGVASLMASAFNTLAVPHITLDLLRALRDRGCTLVNLELLLHTDREWSPARVLRTDHDFKKARVLLDSIDDRASLAQ